MGILAIRRLANRTLAWGGMMIVPALVAEGCFFPPYDSGRLEKASGGMGYAQGGSAGGSTGSSGKPGGAAGSGGSPNGSNEATIGTTASTSGTSEHSTGSISGAGGGWVRPGNGGSSPSGGIAGLSGGHESGSGGVAYGSGGEALGSGGEVFGFGGQTSGTGAVSSGGDVGTGGAGGTGHFCLPRSDGGAPANLHPATFSIDSHCQVKLTYDFESLNQYNDWPSTDSLLGSESEQISDSTVEQEVNSTNHVLKVTAKSAASLGTAMLSTRIRVDRLAFSTTLRAGLGIRVFMNTDWSRGMKDGTVPFWGITGTFVNSANTEASSSPWVVRHVYWFAGEDSFGAEALGNDGPDLGHTYEMDLQRSNSRFAWTILPPTTNNPSEGSHSTRQGEPQFTSDYGVLALGTWNNGTVEFDNIVVTGELAP